MSVRFLRLVSVATLALAGASGCGDAVGNPSLEGFEEDPTPILGRWVTVTPSARVEETFDAELAPTGGTISGFFEFRRFGRVWRVDVADAGWDGVRLTFDAPVTNEAGREIVVEWEALLVPEEGGDPEQLWLSALPVGGTASPIVYVRPEDLP